jgi:uncharacterized protein (TIGR03435 family)
MKTRHQLALSMMAIALAAAPLCDAQPRTVMAPIAFEAASIKPSSATGNSKTINVDFGSVQIKAMSLKDLVLRAYGRGRALQLSRSDLVAGGPRWCETDLYDVYAKPGQDLNRSGEQISEMLKTLLRDRFKLAFHQESKEASGYLLGVAKNGPKMTKRSPGYGGAAHSLRTSGRNPQGGFEAKWRDAPLTSVADYLGSYVLDLPVVDRTGLAGTFDLDLNWTPDETQFGGRYKEAQERSRLPSLFAAIPEQLGLRLEAGKVPVAVIVIDHAEKPAAN